MLLTEEFKSIPPPPPIVHKKKWSIPYHSWQNFFCYFSNQYRDEEDHHRFRNLPWFSQTPITKYYLIKQFYLRSLIYTFIGIGSILWFFCIFDPSYHPDIFQPSQPIESLYERQQSSIQYLSKQLHTYLQSHSNACGIAAPIFHTYLQYLVIRIDQQQFLDIFNPIITIPTTSIRWEPQDEYALLCPTQYKIPYTVLRATSIQLSYHNAFIDQRINITITNPSMAYCIQHYIDIFAGIWLCPADTELRIPLYHTDL